MSSQSVSLGLRALSTSSMNHRDLILQSPRSRDRCSDRRRSSSASSNLESPATPSLLDQRIKGKLDQCDIDPLFTEAVLSVDPAAATPSRYEGLLYFRFSTSLFYNKRNFVLQYGVLTYLSTDYGPHDVFVANMANVREVRRLNETMDLMLVMWNGQPTIQVRATSSKEYAHWAVRLEAHRNFALTLYAKSREAWVKPVARTSITTGRPMASTSEC